MAFRFTRHDLEGSERALARLAEAGCPELVAAAVFGVSTFALHGGPGGTVIVAPLAALPGGHPLRELLPASERYRTSAGGALILGPSQGPPLHIPRLFYETTEVVEATRAYREHQDRLDREEAEAKEARIAATRRREAEGLSPEARLARLEQASGLREKPVAEERPLPAFLFMGKR